MPATAAAKNLQRGRVRCQRHFLPRGNIAMVESHRIHGAGIYANIGGILMVNVTIYSIHGYYGIWPKLTRDVNRLHIGDVPWLC